MITRNRKFVLGFARFLRGTLPSKIPIKIHLMNFPANSHDSGYASIGSKFGHIRIDTNRELCTQIDTLMHEWAHIRVGWKVKEHSQEFWLDHGRIYEVYLEWLRKEMKNIDDSNK